MNREEKIRKKGNKMSSYLRKAIKQAETDANKLSFSVQKVEKCLSFRGFQEGDMQQVTICNGEEIIIVYRGSEIDAPTFVKIMEDVGYITKDNFI